MFTFEPRDSLRRWAESSIWRYNQLYFWYSAAMAARIRCSCIDAVSQFIFDEEMSCSSKFVKRDNTKAFRSDGKHIFMSIYACNPDLVTKAVMPCTSR